MEINACISACFNVNPDVWKVSSAKIKENIKAKKYICISRENQIESLKELSEDFEYVTLESLLPEGITCDDDSILYGIAKVQLLLKEQGNNVLFDGDIVPLKSLTFMKSGKIAYYKAKSDYEPWVNHINATLNIKKDFKFSFNTYCLFVKQKYVDKYVAAIESATNKKWYDAIVSSISDTSKYNEYSSLGTFIYVNFKSEIIVVEDKWFLYGNSKVGIENLESKTAELAPYSFIAFKFWDTKEVMVELMENEKVEAVKQEMKESIEKNY
jgi:hypothetical protein